MIPGEINEVLTLKDVKELFKNLFLIGEGKGIYKFLNITKLNIECTEIKVDDSTWRDIVLLKSPRKSIIEKTYQTDKEEKVMHLISLISETPLLYFDENTFIEEYIPCYVNANSSKEVKIQTAEFLGKVLAKLHSLGITYSDTFEGHILYCEKEKELLITDFGVVGDVYNEITVDFEIAVTYLKQFAKDKNMENILLDKFCKTYEETIFNRI